MILDFKRGEDYIEVLCGATNKKYGDYVGRLKILLRFFVALQTKNMDYIELNYFIFIICLKLYCYVIVLDCGVLLVLSVLLLLFLSCKNQLGLVKETLKNDFFFKKCRSSVFFY